MRVIIAGSRTCNDMALLERTVALTGWRPSVVVSGCARGADALGEEWATRKGIPVARYPADWDTHGKYAGPIRNLQMANGADALIALWDGHSRGTLNMIEIAIRRSMPYRIGLMGDAS